MERAISTEERIRRAEEIYNKRKLNDNNIRISTSKTKIDSNKSKFKLYKKLIIQIIFCFAIYLTMYVIKNSNYFFSENFMKKTEELLQYDIDLKKTYSLVIEFYNNHIKNEINTMLTLENDNNKNKSESESEIVNQLNENSVNEQIETEIETNGGIGGGEDEQIADKNDNNTEETVELSQMEIDARDIKNNYSFTIPLKGRITSKYGPREGNEIISSNHGGIDIGADEGETIISAIEGKVTIASTEGSYGKHIFIEKDDIITVYAHCSKLYVKEGDNVKQGDKIAEVGHTGNATGPHLHFEIRKDGRTVNPEMILSFG